MPPSVPQPTPQAQQPQQGNVAVLDGVLERVTFSNPETGYTIARIAPDRGTGRGPVSADTEQGIRRYLGSGLIKGIGPAMAERMVSHFGAHIMHIIDDEPDRLVEAPGLGPKRSARMSIAGLDVR